MENGDKESLYDVLGVGKDATDEEIRMAFKEKSMKCHPDRKGGSEEKQKRLQEARDILLNPKTRRRYDETGEEREMPLTPEEKIVIQMMNDLIEKADKLKGNLIDRAKEELDFKIDSVNHTLLNLSLKLTKKNKLKGRIKSKKGKDYYRDLIEAKIKNIEDAIESHKNMVETLRKAKVLLDGYEDTRPESEQKDGFGNATNPHGYNPFFVTGI